MFDQVHNAVTAAARDAVLPRVSAAFDDMASSMPSLRSLSKLALGGAQVLMGNPEPVHAGTAQACTSPQLSCHNSSVVENLCCFNYPGGQFLLTSFWDTNPVVGPSDSWTIHGLWPDHCDGHSYDSNCDHARAYRNITAILNHFGESELVSYMSTYWKSNSESDESFWEHEWSKHGTCVSTLKPTCYDDYQSRQEVRDFFNRSVSLFQERPTYEWLAAAGITPSTSATYSTSEIQAALKAQHGSGVALLCEGSGRKTFYQVYYGFEVRGSLQAGQFVPIDVSSSSNCPSKVRYVPKRGGPSPTTTGRHTKTATTTTTALPTSTGSFSGKGFLNVEHDGGSNGCIISGGTWYASGTCATFTATSAGVDGGFTLRSSRGDCAITMDSELMCGSGINDPTIFTAVDGRLAFDGITTFYANQVPKGTTKVTVWTDGGSVELEITWLGK
ncbi:ribonuclease T2-like protein [Phyllosticta citriasiana]|uniref:ribonuclease T2-like protein n=1 Tax=Phyllosticta citriasiana TaxID=595635 RepID=UPI0030FD7518